MSDAIRDKGEILLSIIEHKDRKEEHYGEPEDWISFDSIMEPIHQYSEDGVSTVIDRLEEDGYVQTRWNKNKLIIKPTEEGKNAFPFE